MILRNNIPWLIVFALVLLGACGGAENADSNGDGDTIVVFAASNLEPVMQPLIDGFERSTALQFTWDIRFGSSGMLAQQILLGASGDIFLSADSGYPRSIAEAGMGTEAVVYARGILCFAVNPIPEAGTVHMPATYPEFTDFLVQYLGNGRRLLYLANPELAPYGRAAANILADAGLDNLEPVLGQNVGQTAQFLVQGEGGGFLPLSIARQLEAAGQVAIVYVFDGSHVGDPEAGVTQSGIVLDHSDAKGFLDWIIEDGGKILTSYGYLPAREEL